MLNTLPCWSLVVSLEGRFVAVSCLLDVHKLTTIASLIGAPGVKEGSDNGTLIHHSIYKQEDSVQRRIFKEVCVEDACLDSAVTAVQEIEKVLDGIKAFSRPGYLQVPRDRIDRMLPFPITSLISNETPVNLRASAVHHLETSEVHRERGMIVLEWMRTRKRPVVLAGAHIQRFGMQRMLMQVLEKEGWMCATSLTGKTMIAESHPLSLGIYNGAMTSDAVREDIESSDGVLMIGFPLEDSELIICSYLHFAMSFLF